MKAKDALDPWNRPYHNIGDSIIPLPYLPAPVFRSREWPIDRDIIEDDIIEDADTLDISNYLRTHKKVTP